MLVSCLIFIVSFWLFTCHDIPGGFGVHNPQASAQAIFVKDKATSNTAKPLFDRLDLTEEQCRSVFPLQFSDIDDNLARGPFNFSKDYPNYQGLVQGRIINNTVQSPTPAFPSLPLI